LVVDNGTGEAISVNLGRITYLGEPTDNADAATKFYVDNNIDQISSSQWVLSGNNLYASSTAWNVGVGTNSPGGKLEIRQGMSDFNNAFISPHLKLRTTNTVDNTGFVGVTYDASTSDNYGWSVGALRRASGQSSFIWKYHSNSSEGTEFMRIYEDGNVGIGTTSPSAPLSISSSVTGDYVNIGGGHIGGLDLTPTQDDHAVPLAYLLDNYSSTSTTDNAFIHRGNSFGTTTILGTTDDQRLSFITNNSEQMTILTAGNVGIGTSSPAIANMFTVIGTSLFYGDIEMGNNGNINLAGGNIDAVNKLTVNTIDPLYRIKGVNYSTFAAAIVGGVKEEYVGKAWLGDLNKFGEYEKVIDFKQEVEGSDLWVWYKTIDWARDNVEVLMTSYGRFALTYYKIEGDKLILRADKPVEVAYRLIAKRHDWREWPTKSLDQDQTPGFTID